MGDAHDTFNPAEISQAHPNDVPRGFVHLARQFDLMAKGCRSLRLYSQEDDWDSRRQDANKGIVEPEAIVEAIDYDYRNGHDGRAAAQILIEALCKDLAALSAAKREP